MERLSNQWLGYWVLAMWAIVNIYSNWNSWSWDASALYFAAYFYDLGQYGLVYSPDPAFFWGDNPPPEWVDLAKSQGADVGDMSPFVYPPLWAALLAPLASGITAQQFFNLFYVLNTAAIAGSVYLAHGFIRPQKIAFSTWCFITVLLLQLTTIGQFAIILNQPQIVVTFLIIAAFRSLLADHDISAGVLLALAGAIKIAPILLAIIFVMERRWKALGVFAGVGLALLGLSFLVAGVDLHRALVVRLQDLDSQVLVSRIAVTLDAVIVQVSNGAAGSAGWTFTHYWIQPEPVWVSWIGKLVLLAGLALAFVTTRALRPDLRIWFRLQLVFLITLITGPLAWIHYLILPMLLLPGLIGLARPWVVWFLHLSFTLVFSSILYFVFYTYPWGGNAQVFLTFFMVTVTIAALLVSAVRQTAGSKPGMVAIEPKPLPEL